MRIVRGTFISLNVDFKKCHFFTGKKPCAVFDVVLNFPDLVHVNARNTKPKNSGPQNLSQN